MKRIVPYPLLLIIAVVLDRVVISSTQIGVGQSMRPLSVSILLVIMAGLIIQYFVKDWHYTNFIVIMFLVMMILYRPLYGYFKSSFPQQADYLGLILTPILGGVYAIITSRRVWQTVRKPALVTNYFTLVFALLLSFQVMRLAKDIRSLLMSHSDLPVTAISTLTDDTHLRSERRPDIYAIILDGYARQDILQTIYSHDNSEFINLLDKRGFYVANNSHSNYVQTLYSMASFWNYDYLQPWQSSDDYLQYLLQPIQNNRVFHLLDELGYTTVSFDGELIYTQIENADVYLSNFLPFNKFEILLLSDSPFEPLSNIFDLGIPIPTYKTDRLRLQYQLNMLKEIPSSIPEPKIVYTHILAPHPPFIFDQNGNAIQPQRQYGIWDGNMFEGSKDEYRKGYREQVMFINEEIIEVIDAILSKSETPPIIILMGDHGPASMFNWNFDTPGCLWERTSNLYAVLLPGHQNDGLLYSSITPVNTFRVIFNTYFGTDLSLLEDRSYLMSWQQPTWMEDVTDKTDSPREGCSLENSVGPQGE